MKLFALYLTSKQLSILKKLSHKLDLSIAEIIRRAIDEYLAKH